MTGRVRTRGGVAVLVALCGAWVASCGAKPPPPPPEPIEPQVPEEAPGGEEPPEGVGFEPHVPLVVPEGGARVVMGELTLAAGARYPLPTGPCQEALLLVRDGELGATGTGVAPEGSPTFLATGDAARFGEEGDGVLVNDSRSSARAFVAFVRGEATDPVPTALLADAGSSTGRAALLGALSAPDGGDGCAQGREDPDGTGMRVVVGPDAEELVVGGGTLRVRILLDGPHQGSHLGSLAVLEGSPAARVPEHSHPDSAEVLWVEEGEGRMRFGDGELEVSDATMIYVPPEVQHDFSGAGTRMLRAIQVYAPSGPEQRFRAMAAEGSAAADSSGDEGKRR